MAWRTAGVGLPLLVPEGAPPWLCAAFTSRLGGVSSGPWAQLNLGRSTGDDPRAVQENRRRVLAATGEAWRWVAGARQVHGSGVALADPASSWSPDQPPAADGLVATEPGVLLWLTFADCVPVFLWAEGPPDPSPGGRPRRGVALAHAGWRGTVAGVAAATALRLAREVGVDPTAVTAVIGPSIGPCCFEVDEPVLRLVRGRWPWADQVLRPSPRGAGYRRWNLWETNRRLLLAAGLRPDRVRVAGLCTACLVEHFFSHRASGGRTGRMAGVIGIRAAAGSEPL